jgi:hypothetical protein
LPGLAGEGWKPAAAGEATKSVRISLPKALRQGAPRALSIADEPVLRNQRLRAAFAVWPRCLRRPATAPFNADPKDPGTKGEGNRCGPATAYRPGRPRSCARACAKGQRGEGHAGMPISFSNALTPFQPICTPMLSTMNAERRNTTIMPRCPIRAAKLLA